MKMEKGYCGAECGNCGFREKGDCAGCLASCGCPFGKKCFLASAVKLGGREALEAYKKELIGEINLLGIPGMPEISELIPLNGFFANLTYELPGGEFVKFLDDREIYLGTQVPCYFNDGTVSRYFGVVADPGFLLVGEYGADGTEPELILYRKR